ncbi:MAG TPA: hypothetical protein VKG21_10020 [Casimicrobiaceae bacterium]|nr:hypothetical protein [Casimicrobiaceae bacterium]
MSGKDKIHGEGNYEAARAYNEATKKFVESGGVEAAREAAQAESAARDPRRSERAALLRPKEQKPPAPLPAGYNPYFDLPPD